MKRSDTPFYIGYLKMPAALRRTQLPICIAVVVLAVIAGYTMASQQRASDPAQWDTTNKITLQGWLSKEPYPILHRVSPDDATRIESVLLVHAGKHSAERLTSDRQDGPVAISGFPIQRGGWLMLELDSSEDIRSADDESLQALAGSLAAEPLGAVSLRGEIMDAKCFLGVMKPGSGPVHKACAELCLLGGIPPMLVVRDNQGQKFGYLLTRADGSSASTLMANKVASPVEVRGELEQRGDLLFIRVTGDTLAAASPG